MAHATFTYRDFSHELSSIQFQVTEPNPDGTDLVALKALLNAIDTALEALTLCINSKETWVINVVENPSEPSDENAQREAGMRVFCHDDSTARKFHFTIPGPDKSIVAEAGTDKIDLTITEVAALVTAVEAGALSPWGNSVSVDSAKLVGRNN